MQIRLYFYTYEPIEPNNQNRLQESQREIGIQNKPQFLRRTSTSRSPTASETQTNETEDDRPATRRRYVGPTL